MRAPGWLSTPERDWESWVTDNIPHILDDKGRSIIVTDFSRNGNWVTASCAVAVDATDPYVIDRMVTAINRVIGADYPTDRLPPLMVGRWVTISREHGWLIAMRKVHMVYKTKGRV